MCSTGTRRSSSPYSGHRGGRSLRSRRSLRRKEGHQRPLQASPTGPVKEIPGLGALPCCGHLTTSMTLTGSPARRVSALDPAPTTLRLASEPLDPEDQSDGRSAYPQPMTAALRLGARRNQTWEPGGVAEAPGGRLKVPGPEREQDPQRLSLADTRVTASP